MKSTMPSQKNLKNMLLKSKFRHPVRGCMGLGQPKSYYCFVNEAPFKTDSR